MSTVSVFDLMKAQKQKMDNAGFRPTKLPDGTSEWFIFPHRDELDEAIPAKAYWRNYGAHYVPNADGKSMGYLCDRVTFDQPCELCEQRESLLFGDHSHALSEKQKDLLKKAGASQAFLVNAVRIDGTEAGKVVALLLPKQVFDQVIVLSTTRMDRKKENVFSLSKPQSWMLTRTGTGRDTKYTTNLEGPVELPKFDRAKLFDLDGVLTREVARITTGKNGLLAVAGRPALEALPPPGAFTRPAEPMAARAAAPTARTVAPAPAPVTAADIEMELDLDGLDAPPAQEDDVRAVVAETAAKPAAKPASRRSSSDIEAELADLLN